MQTKSYLALKTGSDTLTITEAGTPFGDWLTKTFGESVVIRDGLVASTMLHFDKYRKAQEVSNYNVFRGELQMWLWDRRGRQVSLQTN